MVTRKSYAEAEDDVHPGNLASGYSGTFGSMTKIRILPARPSALVSTSRYEVLISMSIWWSLSLRGSPLR